MRIFFAAADTPNAWALPDSKLWKVNLHDPLVDLGHDVVRFAYDYQPHNDHLDPSKREHRRVIDRLRPIFGTELLRQLKIAHRQRPIDLFFSYFYAAYVEPEVVREIRRMGIVTVNWYCNGSYQFDLVSDIAPAYDFCLVPEKFRLDDYRRVGANPIYCQEAANPNVYKPHDGCVREFDVTFVGQRYGTRPEFIDALRRAGIDTHVWGPRWEGRPILSDAELIRMYSRSRITLGFSAVAHIPKDGSPPIKQVRLRDFEAPMSGVFYMVEHFDELAEFFEPDREILMFRDADELVDKARYYLNHESERERIRLAGMLRARVEHTWHRRFQDAFAQMGLVGATPASPPSSVNRRKGDAGVAPTNNRAA